MSASRPAASKRVASPLPSAAPPTPAGDALATPHASAPDVEPDITEHLLLDLARAAIANESAFGSADPDDDAMRDLGLDSGHLFAEAYDEIQMLVGHTKRLATLLDGAIAFIEHSEANRGHLRTDAEWDAAVAAYRKNGVAEISTGRSIVPKATVKLRDAREALAAVAAHSTGPRTDPMELMRLIHEHAPRRVLPEGTHPSGKMLHDITAAMASRGAPLSEQQQMILAGTLWLDSLKPPGPDGAPAPAARRGPRP